MFLLNNLSILKRKIEIVYLLIFKSIPNFYFVYIALIFVYKRFLIPSVVSDLGSFGCPHVVLLKLNGIVIKPVRPHFKFRPLILKI